MIDHPFLAAAISEAEMSLAEGGMPIGAVLVHNDGSSTAGTTDACSEAVRRCMVIWTLWKAPAAYPPRFMPKA